MVLGSVLLEALAAVAFVTLSARSQKASAVSDPRQEAPIVRLVTAHR
jgi:hypothetical protein